MKRKNTGRRIGRWMLCVLAMGLAMPAYGQACDPVEVAKLLADDGAIRDYFGNSVSISGDTVIIGARRDDDNGGGSGSAYIFTRSGAAWVQQAKLLPVDGAWGDGFGMSVSISGDTAVVGSHSDDDNGFSAGSAYIFVRSDGVWTQQAKLLASDGDEYDFFGFSVSASGDTAIVGAFGDDDNGTESGSAYIFVRSGGVWTQQAKLLPVDEPGGNRFGWSVSISGDTTVIGAHLNNDYGPDSGSAYVFIRDNGAWTQQAKLLPVDGAAYDYFGGFGAISGETIIIGASGNDDNGNGSGSAYIFSRIAGVWTQRANFLPVDGAAGDMFGSSVSIDGNTAIVGAYRDDDNGFYSGSAYVFTNSGGVWSQQAKLLSAGGGTNDEFGRTVSVSGDTVIVGSYLDDDNGLDSGSANVFDLNCTNCPADLTGNGTLNFFDVSAFLSAFAAQDPIADFTNDGTFNFFDVSAFLEAFAAGCP